MLPSLLRLCELFLLEGLSPLSALDSSLELLRVLFLPEEDPLASDDSPLVS